MLLERLGVQVVGGEVVASRYDESGDVTLLARHSMERLDRAHHCQIRNELVVSVDEQLRPMAVHGQRLDRLAVGGESSVLDDSARFEKGHCLSVGDAVERDRQLELARIDSQVGARHRDALRIAGELEFRRSRLECLELDVAVGENEDSPTLDAAVNSPGHLQDLVRAEVHAREDVPSALDDVAEARVVDDDCVEALHVERALPGRCHGEEVGLLLTGLEERTDDPDWLAAVIVRGIDSRKAHLD